MSCASVSFARAPARARGDASSTRGRPARRSVRASAIDPQPPSEPESGIPRGSTIPRSMGSRRRWEAAASSEVNVGIGAALPALVPWAEDRVAKWATAWEKAAALSPNMPISVMDLTPESSTHPEQEQRKLGPFETDFGAFIYDKGYRQLFRALGYPGADAEAALALDRLNPAAAGGVCLDVSCGPGIITGRIAVGLRGYDALVATDVSDAMTKRAAEQLDRLVVTASVRPEPDAPPLPAFAAVRADVGEMPFADASVDAVHSSAGAHCWPEPKRGFAEVARVLRPGGVFVMSTVVLAGPIREKYVKEGVAANGAAYDAEVWDMNTPFWDADAVAGMLEGAGMVEVEVVREEKCFVMLAARIPK